MKFDVKLKSQKLSKTLPQEWKTADKDGPGREMFVLSEFSVYARKLYDSLIGIKRFYKKKFNADNDNTIDEYIDLFNSSLGAFINVLIKDSRYVYGLSNPDALKKGNSIQDERFSILEKVPRSKKFFTFNENGKITGFTEKTYAKLSKYAKHLFMIEKMCSFTTRKFWKREITKAKNLDLKKSYKIIVKCIVPIDWRHEKKTKRLDAYMKSRNYHSASLIDQKTSSKLFFTSCNCYAMLLLDYDDNAFVCASTADDYSEEVIDGRNLLKDKVVYFDVLLQDEMDSNGENHKFFAEAVECETPKNILHNVRLYSEVNFKNITPKAVISPNKKSLAFAEELAKEYGDIPVIVKEDN